MTKLFTQLYPQLGELLPETLHAECASMVLAKGEHLFAMGAVPEYMYFVQDGEVILERLAENGGMVVLQRTRHGLIGEASMHSKVYHCDARAMVASRVVRIPIDLLRSALMRESAFSTRWIAMLSQELKRVRLQCERLTLATVQERVIHLLKTEGNAGYYALETGVKSLAAELGVSHEALYRCLSALERQGRIRRDKTGLQLQAD